MKMKLWSILLMLLLVIAGCSAEADETTAVVSDDTATSVSTDQELLEADMFSDRDYDSSYDAATATTITLADGNSQGEGVTVAGDVITITQAGTYVLQGSLSNGQVVVNVDKTEKVQLVLDGVTINNDTSAAIYVYQADKVFVTLAEDSVNTLSNQSEFVAIDDQNIDAVIYSRDDITFNGNGSLIVNAAYGNGIVGKDDMVFTSGSYTITAAGHGLEANDSIRIAAGDFTITAGGDGMQAENSDDATVGYIYIKDGTFTIAAAQDGIDAEVILQIEGGTFNISSGEGSGSSSYNAGTNSFNPQWNTSNDTTETVSTKGLKAAGLIFLKGGTFTIDSEDDSIHSNSSITISGGAYTIASGDDGIHADASLTITAGTIGISQSYEGLEGQSITLQGGDVSLVAYDDGLNAAGGNDSSSTSGRPGANDFATDGNAFISIEGGTLNVNASGDGIDSNGNLSISGGVIYVSGPTDSGNGILDYGGTAEITGGSLLAVGSSGMLQSVTSDVQGSIVLALDSTYQIGSEVSLLDASGQTIISYTSEKAFSAVIISDSAIQSGSAYTLKIGSTTQTIEMSSNLYSSGQSGTQPGGGNMRRP